MNIHKKHYYRIGIVFGIVLLSSLYIVRTNLLETNILKSALSDAADTGSTLKIQDNDQFTLALGKYESNVTEPMSILINCWYDEAGEEYFLFVPSGLINDELHWLYSGAEEVYIGNSRINNGEIYHRGSGIYEVRVCGQDYSNSFRLRIMESSAINTLFLTTDSGSLDYLHEAKSNSEGGEYTLYDQRGICVAAGDIDEMHCRGNASWEDTDKKSYQLKLDKKADILGMGEAKKWLLLANAFDNTLLRDATALEMAQELNLAYTPQTEYVDLYINGDYAGNYLLTGKIEIGENRVNIHNLEKEMKELNPDIELKDTVFFMEQTGRLFSTKGYMIDNEPQDISGGYLLELEMSDRYGVEASGFITSRMQPVVFTSPAYASWNEVQYVAEKYQDFEDALFEPDGFSPYTGAYYADYIDMDSFARKYLIEEVTKNLDAAFTSQYIYKPKDEISTRFYAGPAWDYDKAIAGSGITQEGIDLHEAEGLYAAVQTKDSDIWYALYQHADFRQCVADIYMNEMRNIIEEHASNRILQKADMLLDSAMMNAERWDVFNEYQIVEEKEQEYYHKVWELIDFLNKREVYLEDTWKGESVSE